MLPYATPRVVCVQARGQLGAYPNRLACPEYILSVGCAWVRAVFPNSPNSPQFDQFEAVGARFEPGTGADVLPLSGPDGSMDSLSPGRIYGTTSLIRHRYQLAPIGAAAPFSDLMVSRKLQ